LNQVLFKSASRSLGYMNCHIKLQGLEQLHIHVSDLNSYVGKTLC